MKYLVTEQHSILGEYEHCTRDELVSILDEEIAKVPEENRSTVRFLIDTASAPYEDGRYPKLFITYKRLETDKEFPTRVNNEKAFAEMRKEQDRKTYERLRQQFEGKAQ